MPRRGVARLGAPASDELGGFPLSIPGWAIGVAVILLAVSIRRALPYLLRAMADQMRGRSAADPEVTRLGEALADAERRLGELEERADFTERLLSQQRDPTRVAPPGS